MTDSAPDTGADADADADADVDTLVTDGTELALPLTGDGNVELNLRTTEENDFRLSAIERFDGERTVYNRVYSRTFYTSEQHCATIANRIAEQLSDRADETEVRAGLRAAFNQLNDQHEEVQAAMRSPLVDQLLNETQAVNVYGGENTTIEVVLTHEGETRSIEFTSAEWTGNGTGTLSQRYYDAFYERIDPLADEWEMLVESWDDRKRIVAREEMTEDQIIAQEVVDLVSQRISVTDEREALGNSKYAAWYDVANESGDADVAEAVEHATAAADGGDQAYDRATPQDGPGPDPRGDVIWVQSKTIMNQLREVGKNEGYMSTLSQRLHRGGYTYATSKVKEGRKVYGFVPEALGKDRDSIHPADVDREVEP